MAARPPTCLPWTSCAAAVAKCSLNPARAMRSEREHDRRHIGRGTSSAPWQPHARLRRSGAIEGDRPRRVQPVVTTSSTPDLPVPASIQYNLAGRHVQDDAARIPQAGHQGCLRVRLVQVGAPSVVCILTTSITLRDGLKPPCNRKESTRTMGASRRAPRLGMRSYGCATI